jgi:hypothetical protein
VQIQNDRMPSSDSNTREDPWARHYREAAQRRRERGWHRWREAPRNAPRKRLKVLLATAALFVALAIVALLLPR